MNRKTFLNELYSNLNGLTTEDKDSIMFEYETHFDDGLHDGKSEKIIVQELGDPKRIAKELKSTYTIDRAQSNPTTSNVLNAVMATIGLSILNIFFMSVPLFAYISIMISGAFMALIFILSPFILALDYFINGADAVSIFELFMSITLVGAGILIAFGLYYFGKFANQLIIKYAKWNLNTVRGVN